MIDFKNVCKLIFLMLYAIDVLDDRVAQGLWILIFLLQ